ncbi:MAG: class II D-tagatose-bisphosphate aldolase, non-catalytic subunit [Spirochaetes bacterium]|nr:class II D-tagatose-bisphosphate aldolase, non-catalytic subunit [Spirochaetota bacterium]
MIINNPIKKIVSDQKNGIFRGIYSACTANDLVIEAVLNRVIDTEDYVLIEATANQVNQFGGYTGMVPADFRNFVFSIAAGTGFPKERILLGGDHLGPLTWKNEKAETAMEKSAELIRQYVHAGFSKIHIDTSMHLGDDVKTEKLKTSVIARRAAFLCNIAEQAFNEIKDQNRTLMRPVYVIGSEVPVPGGSQDEEETLEITKPSDLEDTIETFKKEFLSLNLQEAWDNIIAVVVQPGVEFGDETIHEYSRADAVELIQCLKKYPGLVFEGHSTDYQTADALRKMVEDGIAILKVGPALTFALREALYALNSIENEIFRFNPEIELSNFTGILDDVMAKHPENWKNHYHGAPAKIRLSRKFSLSDRCRYYLPMKEVKDSLSIMLSNLKSTSIPLTLLSEYMPLQYNKIRYGLLTSTPEDLIRDRIINYIDDYLYATDPEMKMNRFGCSK